MRKPFASAMIGGLGGGDELAIPSDPSFKFLRMTACMGNSAGSGTSGEAALGEKNVWIQKN